MMDADSLNNYLERAAMHEQLAANTLDVPARKMHQAMAATLDEVVAEIQAVQRRARAEGDGARPRWPMVVLRTPKGWTGPGEVDGVPVEGTWRSHQVPLAALAQRPEHLRMLDGITMSLRTVKERLGKTPSGEVLDQLLAKHFPGFRLDPDLRTLILSGKTDERNFSYLPQNALGRMIARSMRRRAV